MELRHLNYFIAVAEEGNVGQAAERLFMAQPPLSRAIQELERELGVALFDRVRKRLHLTEAGRAFLPEAHKAVEQVERAARAARRADRGEVGRVSVGFSVYAFHSVLPRVLEAARRALPDVEVGLSEMCSSTQLRALGEGAIDVGFLHATAEDAGAAAAGLAFRPLHDEPLVAALPAAHPLALAASGGTVRLPALSGETFVLPPASMHPRLLSDIQAMLRRAGVRPGAVQEATPPQLALSLVAAGAGVSLVGASLASSAHPGVAFLALDGADGAPRMELYAAWRPGALPRAAQAFLDLLPGKA